MEELDRILELAAVDACAFLLSLIPGYRDHKLQSSDTVDLRFLKTRFVDGVRNVQGEKDPLSSMWTGPVYFDGMCWPTREHAIVAEKLGQTASLSKQYIREFVLKCNSGFNAKKLGRENSSPQKIAHWHAARQTVVYDVLISAAFTDAQFLTCLMDPMITDFRHVLPAGQKDLYWAHPGENMHGKLLTGVCKAMITVASQLCHFCHNPYIVRSLDHIYLGKNISVDLIPSGAGKVHLLHYPPPPLLEVATQLAKCARFFQEEPVCTDVKLWDNPGLQEQWQTSQSQVSPPRPQQSITPLAGVRDTAFTNP